jgi:hypothetical protein
MRQQTLSQMITLIAALREMFKKDVVTTTEVQSFRGNRPDVYIPNAFWHICRAERGTADLKKFDMFLAANGHAVESNSLTTVANAVEQIIKIEETDEEIEARINLRFDVMDMMARAAVQGDCRSMIVSGSAGIGKSFTILSSASELPEERCSIKKGAITPTGLFRTLWKHRFDSHLIVFDDADDVFDSERSMNFLKAACDSSDARYITWDSNAQQIDEDNEEIPSTFEFRGAVIFITNKDFKAEIEKSNKMTPHFSAMMSRSHYLDLQIKTEREYMVRIRSVVYKSGMLDEYGDRMRDEIVQFIDMNKTSMSELSLRIVKKIADLTRISPDNWRQIASVTCMK